MIKRVGRYEIVAPLGRGGFGQVFSAFDPKVDGMVAIKLLTVESDPSTLARFRNEAAISRRLSSPKIVTIYDSGEQDGTPYIVMELVEGQDLQQVISSHTVIEPWHRLQIVADIATGLGLAHTHGIVHRDVKPANIMLLPNGSIKIMDFGIALMLQATVSRNTKTGGVIGTFRYMAPEQYKGRQPDSRCDIFAFGLLAYELLTGVHPFHATEPAALMYNILHVDPVPVRELWPMCPPQLDSAILRLLEKDPDLRYQTLDDFIFDLQPPLNELRRAKAAELMETAAAAYDRQLLDVAQPLVRQVLEFDPGRADARELRERIQQEIRRQAIRPRVEEAIRDGRERMSAGQLQAAIERFESAAKLDPTDHELVGLLSEARSALSRQKQINGLLADGAKAMGSGDFDEARRIALAVLTTSPNETGAHNLIARAEAAIEAQRREQLLAEKLAEGRRLVQQGSWWEAERFLNEALNELPDAWELQQLAGQARDGLREAERRRRLDEGLSAARQALEAGQWEAAVSTLEPLCQDMPEAMAASALLAEARTGAERQRREAFVASSLSDAGQLTAAQRYSDARRLLEQRLSQYPNEPALLEAMRAAATEELAWERKRALNSALQSAEKLRRAGDWEAALKGLHAFQAKHRTDPAVDGLIAEITRDREAARRAAAAEVLARDAESLIGQGKPSVALDKLRASELAGEPAVVAAIGRAEGQVREMEAREAAFANALNAAQATENAGRFDEAMDAVLRLERNFGTRPEIATAKARIAASKRDAHASALKATMDRASQLLRESKAKEALEVLDAFSKAPEDTAKLAGLRQSAVAMGQEQANRERALQKAISDATALLDQEQWAQAGQALETFRRAFGAHASLAPLLARVEEGLAQETERHLAEAAASIAQHLRSDDLTGAKMLLATVPPADRETPRFAALADALNRAEREVAARKTVKECLLDAENLCTGRRWDAALKKVDTLLATYPGRPELLEARDGIVKRQEADRRGRALREAMARVDGLIRDRRFADADEALSAALRESPGNEELLKRREQLSQLAAEQESAELEIASAYRRAEAATPREAVEILEHLSQLFPSRPDVRQRLDAARNRERGLGIAALGNTIDELCQSGQFAAAREKIAASAWEGPEVNYMKGRVRQAEEEAKEADFRRRFQAAESQEKRSLEGAQQALTKLHDEFPDRMEVTQALTGVIKRIEDAQEAEAERKFVEALTAAERRVSASPEEALQALRALPKEYSHRREVAAAIARVEALIAQRRAAEREQQFARALADVELSVEADPQNARGALVDLDIQFPNRPQVAALARRREELVADRAAAAIEREVGQALADSDRLMKEAPDRALEALRSINSRFPGRPEVAARLRACEQRIADRAAAAAEAEFAQALAGAEAQMAHSPETALPLWRGLQHQYPKRKEVAAGLRICERQIADRAAAAMEADFAKALAAAEAAMADSPAAARSQLQELRQRYPKRKEIATALKQCEKEIANRATEARPNETPGPQGQLGPQPSVAKPILVGAALVVILFATWRLWPTIFPRPGESSSPGKQAEQEQPGAAQSNLPANPKGSVAVESPKADPSVATQQKKKQDTKPGESKPSQQASQQENARKDSGGSSSKGTDDSGTKSTTTAELRPPTRVDPIPSLPAPTPPPKPEPDPIDEARKKSGPSNTVLTPNTVPPPAVIPTPEKKPAAPDTRAADMVEIRNVIAGLQKAVDTKDIDEIRRLWPQSPRLPAWDKLFRDRNYSVTMTILVRGEPEIQGDQARVNAAVTELTRLKGAQPLSRPGNGSIMLQKRGGRWEILTLP